MTNYRRLYEIEEEIFTVRRELIHIICKLNEILRQSRSIRTSEYYELRAVYFDLKDRIAILNETKNNLTNRKSMMVKAARSIEKTKTEGKISIALVEDDADDREFICTAFRDCSDLFDINVYTNGTEFFQSVDSNDNSYQLVITDIRMPLVSGFDVIKKMKENERLKSVPVIVLSTSSNNEDIELAKSLGAAAYYVKPHTIEEYCLITGKISESLSGSFQTSKTKFDLFGALWSWWVQIPSLSQAT